MVFIMAMEHCPSTFFVLNTFSIPKLILLDFSMKT